MADYWLKYRDTRPIFEVVLLNPDGTAHDLTGATSAKLHVRLANGGTVTRDMTIYNVSGGVLRYTWLATDWSDPTAPLVAGTHRMEYEVLGPSTARLTWPNDGYDKLTILSDVGQG